MTAAGALVQARSTGRYLFVKHARTGQWESTGGRREGGEPLMITAAREFQEETGYNGYLTFDGHRYEVGNFMLFDASVPRQFRPVLSSEHQSYVWRSLAKAPRPLHPGLALVVREKTHAV